MNKWIFLIYFFLTSSSFIYIIHKFKEMLPHDIIKELEVKKKFLFDLIKNEFEKEKK